jgi:hypothetical protein
MRWIRGCLAKLLLFAVCSIAVLYVVAAVTNPWAFHIGGRWTLLLFWHGYGKLETKGGAEYPLYIRFFPSYDTGASTLHREGLRPTGALRGSAALCTAPGVIQPLQVTGAVYSAWRTTEGSVMEFSLLEEKYLDVAHQKGVLDLLGRWHGPELAVEVPGDAGDASGTGLHAAGATATLNWGSYSEFEAACASAGVAPARARR